MQESDENLFRNFLHCTHLLIDLFDLTGGSSGQDIEEALKELKSMQQQLDEANEQILVMKTKGKNLFCICDP